MEIIVLNYSDIESLAVAVRAANESGRTLRIARNGTGLSWKVGEGMWTAPAGTVQTNE